MANTPGLSRIYTPQEVAQPVERTRRAGLILELMHDAVRTGLTLNGVLPQHMFWQQSHSDRIYHEPIVRPGGIVAAMALERLNGGNDVTQLVFGNDVVSKHLPHFGTGVLVNFWSGTAGHWQFGVIEYQANTGRVLPYDWHNKMANKYSEDLLALYGWKRKVGKPTTPFKLD